MATGGHAVGQAATQHGFFLVFGLYALSGAGGLPRLPLLRTVLFLVVVIYVRRATLAGGIASVLDGDVKQSIFAAVALLVRLCYASGAVAHLRRGSAATGPGAWRPGPEISEGGESTA